MSEQKYFDTIAEGYGTLDTGTTPVRRFSEVYTLLRRLPPVQGRSVLELACSDGFFSRLIKSEGAASLIAVDLSPQMIALARAHEAAEPLGIDYRVGSVFDIGVLGAFDVVFSPFVMSYAKDRQELLEMCKVLHANLKPGGKLLSMNDNPELLPDSETGYAAYGKTKRISGPAEDGAKLTVTWVVPDAQGRPEHLAFDCRYFTREALEWALAGAGFVDIRIHRPEVSPEGLATFGEEYWARFLENPLLVFIEASKP
ncbi:MAG TPA: class I SAM-dependent methyltransferase [Rhodocyclaceae bacterium]|nr:class I SAM-dependent methyltransferase [Rhodocyclaceae bacterium]HRQ48631.1 class I SAM-dependent methyltransferase [Rhodocyclaceae bacterium]